jgi:hypothetical protein
MSGRFRRAIVLAAQPGLATGEVEDDFHHFAVRLAHDGERVTGAEGRAIRHPWSACPEAAAALAQLVGYPLSAHPVEIYRRLDPLGQCTHMLETAGLAIAQAARGLGRRRYDASVTDPADGRVEAELACDGAPLARWVLQGGEIITPLGLRGLAPTAIRSSSLTGLPAQEAEARLILRRAVLLAGARGLDVDRFPTAAAMDRGRACFVFSPGVAARAARAYGSVRDFSAGPGPLSGGAP